MYDIDMVYVLRTVHAGQAAEGLTRRTPGTRGTGPHCHATASLVLWSLELMGK
jgi:hypothetical protein